MKTKIAAIAVALITLQALAEVVFLGHPEVKIFATGTNIVSGPLTDKDAREYECRIVSDEGRYFWASRDNKELFPSVDGAFTCYCTRDGSGMVKVLTGEPVRHYEFDYFETMSLGVTTFTYWGHRASPPQPEEPSKVDGWLNRFKQADNGRSPAVGQGLDSMREAEVALEKAS